MTTIIKSIFWVLAFWLLWSLSGSVAAISKDMSEIKTDLKEQVYMQREYNQMLYTLNAGKKKKKGE